MTTSHYDFLATHEDALRKAATALVLNGGHPMAASYAKKAHDLVAADMEEIKRREVKELLSASNACAQDAAAAEVLKDISRRLGLLENALVKPKRRKRKKA